LCEWNRRNGPPLDERELRGVFESGGKYAKHTPGQKANDRAAVAREDAPRVQISTGTSEDLSDMAAEIEAQRNGERKTIEMPWPRVSRLSHAFRPGNVCIIAGPAGTGKSFFALAIAKATHDALVPWKYLPLEDRRTDLKFRLLAMLAGDYGMIDVDEDGAARRQDALNQYAATLTELLPHLCENPRVGVTDASGKTIVPALPYTAVLDWIGDAVREGARAVFIDPISQIEFPPRDSWQAEGDFMRKALALANDGGATVCLVAHTIKRGGKNAAYPLTLEDIQGSAMIGRLCHCALLLDAHDPKESPVYRAGGLLADVRHNRSLLIAKTRHGGGTGQRLAFDQDSEAPAFRELGVIAPRSVTEGRTRRGPAEVRTPEREWAV
jgi:KaiC/GvpD/RAD55 family RecA-like ATPase